jgi:hypothetical protein
VAIEHRMDGAPGRDPDIAGKPTDQQLPDFAGAPMRLLVLEANDQALGGITRSSAGNQETKR